MPADGVFVDDVLHVLAIHDELHAHDDTGRKWRAVGNLLSGLRCADDVAVVVTTHPNTRGVS